MTAELGVKVESAGLACCGWDGWVPRADEVNEEDEPDRHDVAIVLSYQSDPIPSTGGQASRCSVNELLGDCQYLKSRGEAVRELAIRRSTISEHEVIHRLDPVADLAGWGRGVEPRDLAKADNKTLEFGTVVGDNMRQRALPQLRDDDACSRKGLLCE